MSHILINSTNVKTKKLNRHDDVTYKKFDL